MENKYPHLKQFFEQHKTKHSFKSFVRHRSPERLRQLDEICSNRSYKTRYEEYLKISDTYYSKNKVLDKLECFNYFVDDENTGNTVGCLAILAIVGIFIFCSSTLKSLLIAILVFISIALVLFCLIFPVYQVIDIFGYRHGKRLAMLFPYYYHYFRRKDYNDGLYIHSYKFAEECDICLQKFLDDLKLFYTGNQEKISYIINYFNQITIEERRKYMFAPKGTTEKDLDYIYNSFVFYNIHDFYNITIDRVEAVYNLIQVPTKIIPQQVYQFNVNDLKDRINQKLKESDFNSYSSKKALAYISWICFNTLIIAFTIFVFKTKHDLKEQALAPLYDKRYTQYENDLSKWQKSVQVRVSTTMTDYNGLGQDLYYDYSINGIDISPNCMIDIPDDNNYEFAVSVTEEDPSYSDYGSSRKSVSIDKRDFVRGRKIVLETDVHESGGHKHGYASFRTSFILSFPGEDNKPIEPLESDIEDEIEIPVSEAIETAIKRIIQ